MVSVLFDLVVKRQVDSSNGKGKLLDGSMMEHAS